MLDVGRLIALAFALAGCFKPRFAYGAVVVVALLAIDAVTFDKATQLEFGLGWIFVGPTVLSHRRHAIVLHLLAAILAGSATVVAFRRSEPLFPEGPEAIAWDRVGLRFLLVATLDSIVTIIAALGAVVLPEV